MPTHPALVHLPIAFAVLMPLVSASVLWSWWRGVLPRRSWRLVIALQVLLVTTGLAASRTGEADEERVEAVVAEPAIEAHEDAAGVFVTASAAVLVLALLAGLAPRERTAQALAAATLAGAVVVLALGYRVGEAGGRLVYEHGAASAWTRDPGAVEPLPRVAPHHDHD